jgi:hypothetical protein
MLVFLADHLGAWLYSLFLHRRYHYQGGILSSLGNDNESVLEDCSHEARLVHLTEFW